MAIFTRNELELFDELFNISNGHILNMSRRKLEKFIYNSIGIDITSESYKNKVKKHRNYFSMKQIYRFILECEDKNKSIKFLNDLIAYIDDSNLKNIDENLLIKAKNVLKDKSDDFIYCGENEVGVVDNTLENTNEKEIVKNPFKAYDGDEPYIFISYAHKDKKIVYKEIKRFHDEGYHIWYDDGLIPGEYWDDEIAYKLSNSYLVVVFISKNSMDSTNVIDEIKFALNKNIDIVLIYLENTPLTPGLDLRLGSKQAILKFSRTDEDYLGECFKAFENASLLKDNISLNEHNDDAFDIVILPGCNEKETNIFKDLCNYCLDRHFDDEIDPLTILDIVDKYYSEKNLDKLQERVAYSLGNLEMNDYIVSEENSLGFDFTSKSISQKGFCFYIKHYLDGKTIYYNVIQSLIKDNEKEIEKIVEKYSIKYSVVEALIKLFRKRGYISCNNDLTDIVVTIAGEEYFEEIMYIS